MLQYWNNTTYDISVTYVKGQPDASTADFQTLWRHKIDVLHVFWRHILSVTSKHEYSAAIYRASSWNLTTLHTVASKW